MYIVNSDSQPGLKRRIALFPGMFDPFTIGHESLVRRGLELMDEIVIGIGINETKRSYFPPEKRLEVISNYYKEDQRVKVACYNSLTVEFAREVGAKYILRGVRSIIDFEYEKAIADMNRTIAGIETFVLFAEPALSHLSSSHVRELLRYGGDISSFIPTGMNF